MSFSVDLYTFISDELEKALKAEAKQRALQIASGGLDTLSSYKEECGVIRGLNDAIFIIENTLKSIKAKEEA